MSKLVSPGTAAFCQMGHSVCSTPSQCYCDCHKPQSWTDKRIAREIGYHRTAITMLETKLAQHKEFKE